MRGARVALVTAIGALAIVVAVGRAGASAPSTASVVPELESWYQPDPTCASPIGCSTGALPTEVAVPSPYPEGTLHVGWASGAETARSYLAFPVAGLGTITSATLTVPLDVDPANGDVRSADAQVRACLATGNLSDVEGAISQPPNVDCTNDAVLEYVASPTPQLVGDLEPLLIGLTTSSGVALLPVADATAAAWHVTFSAHDRDGEEVTPPASLRLVVAEEDAEERPPAPTIDVGTLPQSVALPDLGALPPPTAPPVVQVPVTVAPPPVITTTTPITATVGFAYPGLLLLPLVLLVVVPLVARALTTDLTPIDSRRRPPT